MLINIVRLNLVATNWLQDFWKHRENPYFLKKSTPKNLENTPFSTEDYFQWIREGGRTVGSGRVATVIE